MAESDRRSYRDSAVGRSSETPRAQADDPLAELARLIGQSVPMDRAAGQDRRSTARVADAVQDEVVGEPRDDHYSPPDESRYEQDFNERYELANEERYDRSAHANPPPFIRSSRYDHEADFASAVAQELHDFIGDDRDGAAYNEAEAPSSDPRDDRYGHDEYDHEAHDHSDDHAYGEEYEDYNEGLNTRRRSGFVLVAMIFGLAVLGTAGVFAYRAMFGGPILPALPPIIKAEGGPNKIMPGDANSLVNASHQTDSNTETAASGERLVPREERPVEMPAPVNPAPRPVSTVPIFPDPPSAGGPGAVVGFPALAPSNNPASSTQPPTTIRPDIPSAPPPAVTSAANASSAAASTPLASMSSPTPTPTVPGAPGPKKIRTVSIHTDQPNAADATTGSAPPTRPATQTHDANEPLSIVPSSTESPTATTRPRTVPAQPVPLNKPPANETASAAPVAAASGYTVQVSSQRSEEEAQSSFRDLQAKYPDLLGNRSPIIRRADLGAKGIYYRAMVGPFASDQATELCSNLKAAGGSCLVQKN
jgi:hypothetical protein